MTMFTISEMARAAGVNTETVRYYERMDLIAQPIKPPQGYRRYPQTTLNRMRFIKRAKRLGFSLEEISHLLALGDDPCDQVQGMAVQKLAGIRARITDLHRLETVLDDLLNQCTTNPDQTHCPIIESLLPEKTEMRE